VTQTDTDNNREVVFELDPRWSKYILPKGFVAVDGCSLTVGEVSPGRFNVWLIPETIRATVFATKNVGSTVNIEIESQTQTIVDTIERVLDERGLGSTDVATSSSESSTNAASKTYEPKTKATVSDGYKDPMDELCEEDPSADECKVFD
jgi:riboflavin synthase